MLPDVHTLHGCLRFIPFISLRFVPAVFRNHRVTCPKEEMMAVFQLLHGEDAYRRIDVKETGENQV